MRPTDPLLAATRLLDFQAQPVAALIARGDGRRCLRTRASG